MRRKKGKLTTFIFSCLPGAAEMYMGFMKRGISLMAVFFLSLMIPTVLRISDVFILVAVLVWFYSFFHAGNLAACTEEELQNLTDDYIWNAFLDERKIKVSNPALKKWGAVFLIIYGVMMLWNNLSALLYALIPDRLWEYLAPLVDQVPQVVMALVIIMIGVHMIMGKKEELDGEGK